MESKDMLTIALTKAITDAVPAEMQKEIFSHALYDHLFHKDRDGNTHIQDVFKRALSEAARDMAQKLVTEPESKAKIETAMREALDHALSDGRFMKKVADKMVGSLGYL